MIQLYISTVPTSIRADSSEISTARYQRGARYVINISMFGGFHDVKYESSSRQALLGTYLDFGVSRSEHETMGEKMERSLILTILLMYCEAFLRKVANLLRLIVSHDLDIALFGLSIQGAPRNIGHKVVSNKLTSFRQV